MVKTKKKKATIRFNDSQSVIHHHCTSNIITTFNPQFTTPNKHHLQPSNQIQKTNYGFEQQQHLCKGL